jgi:hypothetical protein
LFFLTKVDFVAFKVHLTHAHAYARPCHMSVLSVPYITYMAQNTSYYMNSYISSEYTDHEVLAVVKYIAEHYKILHSTL